jgi:hypothetical protein
MSPINKLLFDRPFEYSELLVYIEMLSFYSKEVPFHYFIGVLLIGGVKTT